MTKEPSPCHLQIVFKPALFVHLLAEQRDRLLRTVVDTRIAHRAAVGGHRAAVRNGQVAHRALFRAQAAADTRIADLQLL